MKLTVTDNSGVGQVFRPVPREYASLGFVMKTLLDAFADNVALMVVGWNPLAFAMNYADALGYAIFDCTLDPSQSLGAGRTITSVPSSSTSRTTYDWTNDFATPHSVGAVSLQAMIDSLTRTDATSLAKPFTDDLAAEADPPHGEFFGVLVNQISGELVLLDSATVSTFMDLTGGVPLVALTNSAVSKWE